MSALDQQQIRLQQGFAPGEMGFNRYFAQQQFSMAHVRNGSKADVTLSNFDVRFAPESAHSPTRSGCLLWAKRRHRSWPGNDAPPFISSDLSLP
jgi:hypothetical protein